MAVTSTSEETLGFPDHAHAAEGLTFVEFLIEFTLEQVIIVELAGLTLRSRKWFISGKME